MWALDGTFAWLDSTFRVRCQSDELARHLDRLLRPLEAGSAGRRPRAAYSIKTAPEGFELYRGRGRAASGQTSESIVDKMISDLNRTALASFAGFATHAGVVVAHEDAAVVLPAPSGGGKSTLTAACVLRGFDYVSDEALCLNLEDGRVVPYPRPIGLSSWSRAMLGVPAASGSAGDAETYVAAADLGGLVASGPLAVGHVVLVERRPGPPDLVAIRRSEVVASLIRLSFNHYKRPERSFELVAAVARRCCAWRLSCGDPLAAAALLRRRLAE
jgi:hypothetical protein